MIATVRIKRLRPYSLEELVDRTELLTIGTPLLIDFGSLEPLFQIEVVEIKAGLKFWSKDLQQDY